MEAEFDHEHEHEIAAQSPDMLTGEEPECPLPIVVLIRIAEPSRSVP